MSIGADGSEGASASLFSAISADGRTVAFSSNSAFVPDDTNGLSDVFVRELESGAFERVSVAADGTQGNGDAPAAPFYAAPSLNADGRYVAFSSLASNLVPGDTNGFADVFVHDRATMASVRVSVAGDGAEGNAATSSTAPLSADGRYVVFRSVASNLVPGDTNGTDDIFVHDQQNGTTERVSVGPGGVQGNGYSITPSMSADGRYVSFESVASNLVPGDANGEMDIFVHDRVAGITGRVSVASDGTEGNGHSYFSSISGDGRHVAFNSAASSHVPTDVNGFTDVFVHDRITGTTERVSVGSDGAEGNNVSFNPSVSGDGRFVAFNSLASNLVAGDTNGAHDVLVRDRQAAATERVSVGSAGEQANSYGALPSVSADGSRVSYYDAASNLVPGDSNKVSDVYVRERGEPVGVGGLTAVVGTNDVSASGWATFSGAVVTSASDPPGDAGPGGGEAGADLLRASLTYRPEQEDLLARLALSSLPGRPAGGCAVVSCVRTGTGAGIPAVLYGLRFDLGGVPYEIRALRAGATAVPPTLPFFALYRCEPDCAKQTTLSGGLGTTATEVLISIPRSALQAEEGATVTGAEAFTALGEAATGALVTLDRAALPTGTIPTRQVSLGIVPRYTPEQNVGFDTAAVLAGGIFSGTLDVGSLQQGNYDLWARACLGDHCLSTRTPVGIG